MARIVPADKINAEAVALLGGGELVAVPTETVYGLAADAMNGLAVARIFDVKDRPRFNPLIAHVADQAMAEKIAVFDPLSRMLAGRFWPGPLTLVLPLREDAGISALVTAGQDTIALRMPVGVARTIAASLGRPLAAPSANPSGRLSATTASDVKAGLGTRISLIVDGGPARIGVESTIVRVCQDDITLLRPGGVPVEDIARAAGRPVKKAMAGSAVEAPGMLASHYAPKAALRLAVTMVSAGEAVLAFGPNRVAGAEQASLILNLSENGNLQEAAANLFSHLHRLDAHQPGVIAIEPVPALGLGAAINDRLTRAAAPRDQVTAGPEDRD